MPLSRVIIKNYKSIKHCDVTLSGLNVLIGENGTGKTNLLEAINYFYNNLTDNNVRTDIFDENNRYVVIFTRDNSDLLKRGGPLAFLAGANQLQLKQRNLMKRPFRTIFQFVQYMCGYRAFLISLLDENETDTIFQKDLRKLISKIEKQVDRLV